MDEKPQYGRIFGDMGTIVTTRILNPSNSRDLEEEQVSIVFVLTPKQWASETNATGIISKPGRYGGTYAHKDIAFEFASWISVEFKLYLIKEFQRLKDEEYKQLGWDIRRNLTKINYRIHTDAIKMNLIPPETYFSPDEPDIYFGGRYSEHGLIWHDSQTMA